MEDQKGKDLLANVKKMLKEEGTYQEHNLGDEVDLMKDYVLVAIRNNKDIQRYLFREFLPAGRGLTRNVKNKVLGKIANVVRNTVETSFIKQQKFNDNVLLLLEFLFKENQELRNEIKNLTRESHGK